MCHGTQQHSGIGVAQIGCMETSIENGDEPLRLLTLKETAEILQLSQRTALRMIERKQLPGFKVRGQWRVHANKLAKLLK